MPDENQESFSPEDFKAFRLLAVSLGIVVAVLLWIAPDEPFLIVGMAAAMMAGTVGGVFLLRKLRRK